MRPEIAGWPNCAACLPGKPCAAHLDDVRYDEPGQSVEGRPDAAILYSENGDLKLRTSAGSTFTLQELDDAATIVDELNRERDYIRRIHEAAGHPSLEPLHAVWALKAERDAAPGGEAPHVTDLRRKLQHDTDAQVATLTAERDALKAACAHIWRAKVEMFLDIPISAIRGLSKQRLRKRDIQIDGADWSKARTYCAKCGKAAV